VTGAASPERPVHRAAPVRRAGGLLTAALLVASLILLTVAGLVARPLLLPAPSGGAAAQLGLPGGVVQLNQVRPEVLAHMPGMPGTMVPDPLPAGFRRLSLDVTLLGEEQGLRYDAVRFRIVAPGVRPVAPSRDALGSGLVPAGSRVDGELVFQVPTAATGLSLTVLGADEAIEVEAPPAADHQRDAGHAG
jgi:hypothetical protein